MNPETLKILFYALTRISVRLKQQTPSTSFTAIKSGVHKFSKDLRATSKLQTPEWWSEASSTL